jgi:hypothetical protein
MNRSAVEKSGVWDSHERLPPSWQPHGLPLRRVRDQVVPLASLLALIALTVLGSTLALFYWFAAALTSSSLILCPDAATCIVETVDAEAACQAGEAACPAAGGAVGGPATQDPEIAR